jgi:hypothetical protein
MIKKIFVYCISLMLVFLPVSQSYALGEFVVPAGMQSLALAAAGGGSGAEATIATMAASGGSAANPVGVGLAALAVGMAVGYFGLEYLAGGSDDPIPRLIVPVTKTPTNQLPAPTGAAPVVAVSPVCPVANSSEAVSSTYCKGLLTFTYSLNSNNMCDQHYVATPIDISGCPAGYNYSGDNLNYSSPVLSCGSGYSYDGSQCNLTDPRSAINDGRVDLPLDQNGKFKQPTDKDTLPDKAKPTISPDGNKLKYHGYVQSGDGQKHDIWLAADASGSANDSYQMQVAYVDPAVSSPNNIEHGADFWSFQGGYWGGATLSDQGMVLPIKTTSIQIDNGVITGMARTTTQGVVAAEGTTYIDAAGNMQTVAPQELIVTAPTTTGVTPTQVQPSTTVTPTTQAVAIPTDYARSGEAATASRTITDKLSETPDSTADLAAPALENPLSNYFNPLRSWTVPSNSGTCPTGSFSWNDNTYTFNVICQLFNENLPIIQGAMNVLYALSALFIVLGA